jgi:hypothetical protein
MRRVQLVDVTAVHLLSQIRDSLAERAAFLVFSGLTHTLPDGRNLAELFERMEAIVQVLAMRLSYADKELLATQD